MGKAKKIIPKIIIVILLFVIILINLNDNTSFALANDDIIDNEKIEDIALPEGIIVSRNTMPSYTSQTWTRITDTFLLGASGDYPVGSTGGSEDSILPAHTHTFTGTQVTSSSNGAHTHSAGVYAGTQSKKTSTSSKTKLKSGSTTKASTSTGAHQHTVTPTGTISTDGNETQTGTNVPPYKTYNMYKRASGGPFTVNVVALNGTISGDTTKTANAGTSPTFIVNASSGYGAPIVKCTHLQNATVSGTTLTVSNVSNNTTCTVQFQKLTAATTIIAKAPTVTGTINSDGLMKLEQPATGQKPAQTEYRYSGSNVKNYVTFNGEKWRIIGVFSVDDGTGIYEQRVKIMRDEFLRVGGKYWDSSGVNEWSTASLKTELNGTYYNEISSTAQNMIAYAKWYTSSYNPDVATNIAYTSERASTTEQFGSTRNTNWTGKIALAYPSDYGYASSGCYTRTITTLYDYSNPTCTSTNWMFKEDYMWLLSPRSDSVSEALCVDSDGFVIYDLVDYSEFGVWPVTYLKKDVEITGGSGTSSDPYTLSLPVADLVISKAPTVTGTINSDGLMKLEQPATGQTPAQTEYRYSGSDVKNYVTFNGEPWRIIGVFSTDDGTGNYEQRVKIMRDSSIGDYSWDSSASTVNGGLGINEWSQADLKTELNTTYYNRQSGTCYNGENNASTTCDFSSTGLTETARNMIGDAKWYTSSFNPLYETTSIVYTSERASTTTQCGSFSSYDCSGESVARTTNWTGKIALAYVSDYGYASGGCYTGTQTFWDYNYTTCTSTNWMFNGSYQWLLSPDSNLAQNAQRVQSSGSIFDRNAINTGGVRPVAYLKSSVKITGGSGTSSDPYTLG